MDFLEGIGRMLRDRFRIGTVFVMEEMETKTFFVCNGVCSFEIGGWSWTRQRKEQ